MPWKRPMAAFLPSKPSETAPTSWFCFPTAAPASRSRIASSILSIRRSPSARARGWVSASASASSRNTPERFFVTTVRKAAQFSAWNCPQFWQPSPPKICNSPALRRSQPSPPDRFSIPGFQRMCSLKRRKTRVRVLLLILEGEKGDVVPEIAIQTHKLTRKFGNLTAVEAIDLQVAAGQFFGFLGPNGAGKSTTIKMLTGLLAPTAGSMQLLGLDFAANPVEVKRQIGVVPEGMGLFERLTGSEYLHFVGRMYGLDRQTTKRRSEELLDFMQLTDRPQTMVADYSHGMQKKLALAAAVIHGPRILFLDEPFEGVDALAAGALKALLGRMTERGATIFLTSHVLEIVERLCSHVAIIHQGRLVAQGSLEELRAGVEAQTSDRQSPPSSGEKLTLEQIFLRTVGGSSRSEQELSWLG